MTCGHTTSLQPSIQHLVVVWMSYDIAMLSRVHWLGSISQKKLFLVLKNDITYRFSKTLKNTYEGVQFSEVADLQPANTSKDMKQGFQTLIHKKFLHSFNLFDKYTAVQIIGSLN